VASEHEREKHSVQLFRAQTDGQTLAYDKLRWQSL